MKKLSIMILLAVILVLLTACREDPSSQANQAQENLLVRPAPPGEYVGLRSPKMSAEDIEQGKKIYQINCASCHGEKGMGDGPAATSLDPKPEPIAVTVKSVGDDYLFWRISEGGIMAPFKSAMPAWKTILKEQQIWQVINYLHLFGG